MSKMILELQNKLVVKEATASIIKLSNAPHHLGIHDDDINLPFGFVFTHSPNIEINYKIFESEEYVNDSVTFNEYYLSYKYATKKPFYLPSFLEKDTITDKNPNFLLYSTGLEKNIELNKFYKKASFNYYIKKLYTGKNDIVQSYKSKNIINKCNNEIYNYNMNEVHKFKNKFNNELKKYSKYDNNANDNFNNNDDNDNDGNACDSNDIN